MELIIAQSMNQFSLFKEKISKSTDILVFDQNIMIELHKKGMKYKVIEDFYTPDEYYKDVSIYHDEIDSLLSRLDEVCKYEINFPYAFNGNGHYLYKLFNDLFYLEKLIQILKKKYKKIFLYSTHIPREITINDFIFSKLNSRKINGTISFELEMSAKRKIKLIYNSIEIDFLKDKDVVNKKFHLKFNVIHFIKRLKRYFNRKIFSNNYFKQNNKIKSNKKIYLIQDSYEVNSLKKYLPKFTYLNPTTKLRQSIEIEHSIDLSNISLDDNLESFAKKYFSFLQKYFYQLMNSYLIEIVGRVKSFKDQFELLIRKDNPRLLLLGVGTRDVFDMICCYVANYNNIPVIIFQHGVSRIFIDDPCAKSAEYNTKVLKTLIVQSKKDVNKLQNKKTKVFCFGSINQYENNNLFSNEKPTKDIIFCIGPNVNFSFRHLLESYSMNKKHQQSIDIIDTAEEISLSIDLKLHPMDERNSLKCYSNILKSKPYKKTGIIYGEYVETISKNYKLIIIDFLSSRIRNHIFSLKVPIIIYDRDFDKIKIRISNDILIDLSNRCYIARNKNELRNLLDKYKAGKLPSKWSMDIIDNYMYPIANGNPGIKITEYIENLMLDTN